MTTPLSERLRPRRFQDVTSLRPDIIDTLQRMVDNKDPMNLLLHGPPGTGKTSAALIFLRAWEEDDVMKINGALDTGIDYIRERVAGFARTPFRTESLVLCFIDEADHLSSSAQDSLRVIIEQTIDHCRFILAVNELNRLRPPLISRLYQVNFANPGLLEEGAKLKLLQSYSERLSDLGMSMKAERLEQIVTYYYPDFRRIANALDFALR